MPDGQPLLWSSKQYNVSFRFGVLQADKMRACDDLKHSMTNLTCTVETPTRLLSWDNIAQISAMLAAGGGDWAMFKAYHKAAYKQLPIDPLTRTPLLFPFANPPSADGAALSHGPLSSGQWPLSSTITYCPGSWRCWSIVILEFRWWVTSVILRQSFEG